MSWEKRKPEAWYDAMYAAKAKTFKELHDQQIVLLQKILRPNDAMIELGSGSAEMLAYFCQQLKWSVGIEISASFIEFAEKIHPRLQQQSAILIQGDMLATKALLEQHLPATFWDHRRVVTILMNTIGIMPKDSYASIINTMQSIAKPQGVMIVGCWNRDYFAKGIKNFYQQHPELCGPVNKLEYDLVAGDLYNSVSGYISHWFTHDELYELLQANLAQAKIEIIAKDMGLFGVVEFDKEHKDADL